MIHSADSFVWVQSQLGMAGGVTSLDLLFPTLTKRIYDDDRLHGCVYWLDMVNGDTRLVRYSTSQCCYLESFGYSSLSGTR